MSGQKKPNSSLEDLKRALQTAESVMVDETGRLVSEDTMTEDAYAEKNGGVPQSSGNFTRVKPTRWF
ncbi:MAG: hypothetical protein WCS37_20355 [Chloroflexota bacterium]|nr:hypothetical protein [Chloroflexota bacterium]